MQTNGGEGRANQDLIDICFGVGLSVKTTAWVVGESTGVVWHEWSVRTGLPTPGDPPPSAIRSRAKEVQNGWSEHIRQLAAHGCTRRPSSKTVDYRQIQRRANQAKYDKKRIQRDKACRSGSIDAKANQSPSPVTPRQMTLLFACTASEAIA